MRAQRRRPPQATAYSLPEPSQIRLSCRLDIEPNPAGLRMARAFVRAETTEWCVPVAAANAAIDVGHELVTNALVHGSPPIALEMQLTHDVLVVLVSDANDEAVRTLPYRPGVSERGLGLRLVSQLSASWGQYHGDAGKTVWATVALTH